MKPDLRKIARRVRKQGFTVEQSRGTSHWTFYDAGGRCVAKTGNTPSDNRWIKNLKADLRRAGADI